MVIPERVTRGRCARAQNWQSLNTPHGPLTGRVPRLRGPKWTRQQVPPLRGETQGPEPPGLLLGVKLQGGPMSETWRVLGSGGNQAPPSSPGAEEGRSSQSRPHAPLRPLSLLPLLLSASLRASVPSPRSDSWLASTVLGSLLSTTLHPVTSSSLIQFTLSEGHGRASRSS